MKSGGGWHRPTTYRREIHDQRKHGIDQREERPEIELGEEQGTIAVEGEYVGEKMHFFRSASPVDRVAVDRAHAL